MRLRLLGNPAVYCLKFSKQSACGACVIQDFFRLHKLSSNLVVETLVRVCQVMGVTRENNMQIT